MKIASAIAIGIVLMVGSTLNIGEYSLHKIDNLFNEAKILEGYSSAYRLESMQLVIDDALSSTKKRIIGNGWGQTRTYLRGVEVQAGRADIVNIRGIPVSWGLSRSLTYTLLFLMPARKNAPIQYSDNNKARFAAGVMFAIVGVFCTGQMAGYIITPEYWILIGLSIYLSIRGPSLHACVQSGRV